MTYAVYTILKRNPDAVIVATPSDHVIRDEELFKFSILNALEYAGREPVLMTLGIVPKSASDNFGYIQVKGGRHNVTDKPLKVKTFTEKPSEELAKVFIRSGEFYWNSGIYVWSADTIRKEMERLVPEVTRLFTGWEEALGTPGEKAFLERAYADCPKISLYDFAPTKDRKENAIRAGKTLVDECRGNLVLQTRPEKLVAVKGLEDFIVVDTDDVLMICPRDDKSFKDFISDIAMPDFEEYR